MPNITFGRKQKGRIEAKIVDLRSRRTRSYYERRKIIRPNSKGGNLKRPNDLKGRKTHMAIFSYINNKWAI